MLGVGCWVLGVGCWVLGDGCWVLGVGCFLPCHSFEGTEAATGNGGAVDFEVMIAGEDTVLATNDARHQVALLVGIGHALAVYNGLGLGREFGPSLVEQLFDLSYLVHRHGRACIALYAAGTLAGRKVAAETLRQDF